MERLTYRDKCGYAMMAPEHEEQHSTQEWIDMLENRLAAYEDTGLEPEEIETLKIIHGLPAAEIARICNIYKADRENRANEMPNYCPNCGADMRELPEPSEEWES